MEMTMTLSKSLIAAVVLIISLPVVPALAHDDEDQGTGGHNQLHDQLSDSHERAHDEGFYSRGEHNAYHRALRDYHDDSHDRAEQRSYYERPRYRSYYRSYRDY
jgi:hypothetical protein